ncbi:hypothetical protein FRC17_009561, partial [Serendipita sp. 399]
ARRCDIELTGVHTQMARTTQLTIITRSKSLNRPTVNVQNVSLVSRASSTMVVALSVVLSALAAILLVLVLLFSVRYYRNTKRRASRELTASGGGRGSGIIHRERSTRRPPVVVGTLDELPIGSNGESGGLQSWIANATSGGRTNEPSSSSAVATTTMVEQVSNRTTVSSGSDNGRGNRPFRIPRKPPPTNTPSGRENVSSMILDAPISGFDSGGIEDSKAEEVETEIRHGTDPIPIPFAKLMRKETDSTCSDTPIQPGVMEERNVEFVESERAEKAMSVSSTFPMSTSSRPSPSEASRPWPVVRTISDVAVSRGVKVGHIASNFPLVYCPEPHEGHLSARGSIHSGATHEVGPNDSERIGVLTTMIRRFGGSSSISHSLAGLAQPAFAHLSFGSNYTKGDRQEPCASKIQL